MGDETSRYDTVTVNGVKVQECRKQGRLTQQRLADSIGRSRGWISIIEGTVRARVSRTTAERLADALKVRLADLLEEDEESHRNAALVGAAAEPLGDFTFGTPSPVSGAHRDDDAELTAILSDLRRLEQRIERLLVARRRRR